MGWMPIADGSLSTAEDDHEWIPIEIGMPRSLVDVEIKSYGPTISRGWYSDLDKAWFMRGERHPALISGVTHWRPMPTPPNSCQVGRTALSACGQPPSYCVLDMTIDGQRSKWVDMATAIRLRDTIGAMITAYRGDVPIVSEEFEKLIQGCEAVWRSSPAE